LAPVFRGLPRQPTLPRCSDIDDFDHHLDPVIPAQYLDACEYLAPCLQRIRLARELQGDLSTREPLFPAHARGAELSISRAFAEHQSGLRREVADDPAFDEFIG
jgi:hypothetical protein